MKKAIDMNLKEARRVANTFKLLFIASLSMIGFGVLFYSYTEGWSKIDALYFSVVSLTTVGYGDLTPATQSGRLFTVFYLLAGIGIIAAFINNMFKGVAARRALKTHKESEKLEEL
jgi:voltage-gated potassium channel Kch